MRPSAQRLSASKKFGHHQVGRCERNQASAQRLSASKKFGPLVVRRSNQTGNVLNAFRHQRSSDTDFRREWSAVLVGAQRLSASKKFGLLALLSVWLHARVLNAFQHQRSSDNVRSEGCEPPNECSTPFGIKEVRTTRCDACAPAVPSAQRLSASKKFGPHHWQLTNVVDDTPGGFTGLSCADQNLGINCSHCGWVVLELSGTTGFAMTEDHSRIKRPHFLGE